MDLTHELRKAINDDLLDEFADKTLRRLQDSK
jgi:hypothetical protein